jgi:hypothetical protein
MRRYQYAEGTAGTNLEGVTAAVAIRFAGRHSITFVLLRRFIAIFYGAATGICSYNTGAYRLNRQNQYHKCQKSAEPFHKGKYTGLGP